MRQYLDFLDHPLVSVAGLLLVLGLVTASISACGCCGALHEHHGLTSTYSWVLGTIVLVELGLGLMLYTASSQVSCSRHTQYTTMRNVHTAFTILYSISI